MELYEPAQRAALPAEEDWDTRAYLRHIPTVFEAVRHEFGPELPLLHDGHHHMTPISPVGMAAALHLDLAIHNFGIQEYMRHGELTNTVFEQSFTFADGHLHPGDQPGLGVELNMDAAKKHPYTPAYLPFNRLKDGTIHDW